MATCDQIDDYLCGWLDPDAAADFADHLANCETCRSALELQQRIDGNIAAWRESVAIPESVMTVRLEPPRNPDSSRSRVSGAALSAVLAAAAVLLGIGVGLYLVGLPEDKAVDPAPLVNDTPGVEALVSVEPEQSPDEEDTSVAIEPGPGTILVQVPSSSSRVSVFRVYNVISQQSERE
jgi:anti-sigma factor RsiW